LFNDIKVNDPQLYSKLTILGNADAIKIMIDIGINTNTPDGRSAVLKAATNGNIKIIKMFVNSGINPAFDNNSLIIEASKNNHIDAVRFLLSNEKVDPTAQNDLSYWFAIENGHAELVELFLHDNRINPGTKSRNGFHAIEIACYKGYSSIVKLLMKNDKIDPSTNNNSSLKYAIAGNKREIILLLLSDLRIDPSVVATEIDLDVITEKKMLDTLLNFDKIIPKLSRIPIIYKNDLMDSLKGIAVSYYYLNLQFTDSYIRHYFTNPEGQFYDSILRYIVLRKPTDIQIINYLNNFVNNGKQKSTTAVVRCAAMTILDGVNFNECNKYIEGTNQLELYEALIGLFQIFYRPKYTYLQLLKLPLWLNTTNQGRKMAVILIGAYMGYAEILFQQRDPEMDSINKEIMRFANQTDNLTRLP
jgi:hypothetical protein